jgi:putative addiction module killer protein
MHCGCAGRRKGDGRVGACRAGRFVERQGVGAGVFECRIDFGPGYRIYVGKDGETLVILVDGGTKKRQPDDIAVAHVRWKDYKQRKAQEG